MSRDPRPTGKQRRDQQTTFMLTKDEKERLLAFVERRMSTVSDACRYLVLRGLEQEEGE